jgi:CubicO group peptidase (beta-lactamase class C family)
MQEKKPIPKFFEFAATEMQNFKQLIQEANIPGLSFAIIKGNNIFNGSLGFGNLASTDSYVTDRTVFEACSLSKPVFSYLIIKLIENKLLQEDFLKQSLYSFLPNYDRFANNDSEEYQENLQMLTAELILSHQTGWKNWSESNEKLKFLFKPGENFNYSGEGYLYLQKVIEHITGRSLESLAQEFIFRCLDMQDSTFLTPENIAVHHNEAMKPLPRPPLAEKPAANAAASLHTTAKDYARFIHALLNDRKAQELILVPHVSMVKDQVAVDQGLSEELLNKISWGLGWGFQISDRKFFHWGDNGSTKAFAAIDLSGNAAIFFANGYHGLSIIKEVSDKIGGLEDAVNYLCAKYNFVQYTSPGWKEMNEGFILEAKGNYEQALTSLKTALTLMPDNKLIPPYIEWLNAMVQSKSFFGKINSETLQKYEGEYGPLIITSNDSCLTVSVAGRTHQLTTVSSTLFADTENKIKVQFNLNNSTATLTSYFINGHQETLCKTLLSTKFRVHSEIIDREKSSQSTTACLAKIGICALTAKPSCLADTPTPMTTSVTSLNNNPPQYAANDNASARITNEEMTEDALSSLQIFGK